MAISVNAVGRFYKSAPAGATTELKQSTAGKAGDEIDWIWIESGAGTVALVDGLTTIFTWDAQTSERFIPLNIASKTGGWSLITVGVAALAGGNFA